MLNDQCLLFRPRSSIPLRGREELRRRRRRPTSWPSGISMGRHISCSNCRWFCSGRFEEAGWECFGGGAEPTGYEGGEAVPNRSGIPGMGLEELWMGIQCYIHCLMVFFEGGGGAQILHWAGEDRGGKEGATLNCSREWATAVFPTSSWVKFFMFVQALKEGKEERKDAQQVFKITYVTFVMFKWKMFGLAQIFKVPKAGWRGGEGDCQCLRVQVGHLPLLEPFSSDWLQ